MPEIKFMDRLANITLSKVMMWVVGMYLAYGVFIFLCYPPPKECGQFGDAFGGLNALYTGLAFGVVAYSLWVQHKENIKRDTDTVAQLTAMQTTAKISALPMVIDFTIQRIQKNYQDILVWECNVSSGVYVNGLGEVMLSLHSLDLDKMIGKAENYLDAIVSAQKNNNGQPVKLKNAPTNTDDVKHYIEDLKRLRVYTSDMVSLYDSLSTTPSTVSPAPIAPAA